MTPTFYGYKSSNLLHVILNKGLPVFLSTHNPAEAYLRIRKTSWLLQQQSSAKALHHCVHQFGQQQGGKQLKPWNSLSF